MLQGQRCDCPCSAHEQITAQPGSEMPPGCTATEPQFQTESVGLPSLSPEHSIISGAAHTAGFFLPLHPAAGGARGRPPPPGPTAFLSWKITGLLCSARQGSRAPALALGTLNRSGLPSRSPSHSDRQRFRELGHRGRSRAQRHPPSAFRQRAPASPLHQPDPPLAQDQISPAQSLCILFFFFCIRSEFLSYPLRSRPRPNS